MAKALKLFILAGEPSGDRIAADLVIKLRQKAEVELIGIGGGELIGHGLQSLFPMSDLSVMGLSDVLKRLPLLLWRVEQTARAIVSSTPDIVVLVDAQEFSALVARRLKQKGFSKPVLLYVAPSVWARKPERAQKLKQLFDEVLAVLPFEPGVMLRLGGPPTFYVGHPALAETAVGHAKKDEGLIALLPGSRDGELRRHLALFRQLAEAVGKRSDVKGFIIPTLASLADRLRAETSTWSVPVQIVTDRQERLSLYNACRMAVSCAGTATLELAMAGLPTVVTYVMDGPQRQVFERIGRPQVGLPNIILGESVTPEIILDTPSLEPLLTAVTRLLDSDTDRNSQAVAFERLGTLMENGTPDSPRENAADRVLAHIATRTK